MSILNHYTCYNCHQTFIRITPEDQALKEHEERKKIIPDYDDGLEPVLVCNDCFEKVMRFNLCPKQ
jgi:hypothetical protein